MDFERQMTKKSEKETNFLERLERRFAEEAGPVKMVADRLTEAGFEPYLVGGCVRDFLLGKTPKDWDITTNAKPEDILKIFPDSVYENDFGTVGVKTGSDEPTMAIVEVTPFRKEGKYSDKRHPDEVVFADTIEEDLGRRDFTINAMAFEVSTHKRRSDGLVDMFDGFKDLEAGVIRTVGDPDKRFQEDAIRLMRAARFAVQLDFKIEERTAAAVKENAFLLEVIAKERIRDEFMKVIMCGANVKTRAKREGGARAEVTFEVGAARGVQMLEDLGLLKYFMPELREGIDCGQNKHHIYTVWEHNLRALDYAAKSEYSQEVRLASLLHDVGKPRTKMGDGHGSTFYAHEMAGAKMTLKILDRMKFPKDFIEKVAHLVRFHLFYYNVGEVTEAGVRRFIARVGAEHIDDLLKVREADRIGSGVPKAFPYKLRHLQFMIDKVRRDPVSPKMLAVKGDDVIEVLKIPPGPRVGWILALLLDEVLEEPSRNTTEDLRLRVKELGMLSDKELEKMARGARERKDEFEEGAEEEMKRKHRV